MTDSTDGKRSAGSPFKPPHHDTWNGMVAVGDAYRKGQLQYLVPPANTPASPAIVKIKNGSGAERARGEVLMLGDKLLESIEADFFWLDGSAPKQPRRFGVLLDAVQDGDITECQLTGVCIGRVNVTSTDHQFATIKDDTYVLQSAWAGPIELAWTPTTTGEADCIINIGRRSPPLFKTGSQISARSGVTCNSQEATPYYINDDGDLTELQNDGGSAQTGTIYHFGSDFVVPANSYCKVGEVFGKLLVTAVDRCS